MAEANTADPPSSSPNGGPVIVYQKETTGSYWGDVKEAVMRVSLWNDLQRIGEIPCARNSLLSGIASGVGIGVIRGLSVGPLAASNWAVGVFTVISMGTWKICQSNREQELRQLSKVVEATPKRFAKQKTDVPDP